MGRSGISLLGLCLLALAVPRWSVHAQPPCSGVERWAVKVAADQDANLIDAANPITTTLHDLVAITRPQLPPGNDETTRLPEERTVRIVDGRLLEFRLESGGDGDLELNPGDCDHGGQQSSLAAPISRSLANSRDPNVGGLQPCHKT